MGVEDPEEAGDVEEAADMMRDSDRQAREIENLQCNVLRQIVLILLLPLFSVFTRIPGARLGLDLRGGRRRLGS